MLCLSLNCLSQNTVGILNNLNGSYNGYTLISPTQQTLPNHTYLINNCGNIINSWSSNYALGKSNYLLKNGNLLRITSSNNSSDIVLPGKAGRTEIRDWDNNLIWEFDLSNNQEVLHHDVFPMSNGNILILIARTRTYAEAIQAGRDPSKLTDTRLLEEYIIEVEPTGLNTYNLIWQWNSWDHLIQDYDNTKDNFGTVEDNPQLLNINHLGLNTGAEDWLHFNSMYYNEELDQIALSSRNTGEFYIIDHSTTTAEAAGHTGGNSNMGGDYLYRWGNPQAYNQGTAINQKSFGQHSVHWIPEGHPNAGKILFFNNGAGRGYSSVDIISTPYNASTKKYDYTPGSSFLPENTDYTYTDPNNQSDFFARFVSSAQMLPNGNILINNGPIGYIFEINPTDNSIVWEYMNPIDQTIGVIPQGSDPNSYSKLLFRAKRYPTDYEAFDGKDLTPGNNIEQNNQTCNVLDIDAFSLEEIEIFPNPTNGLIHINNNDLKSNIEVFSVTGKSVYKTVNKNLIDITNLSNGIYLLKVTTKEKFFTVKIIKN